MRVPTHKDGSSLFWEFATDSYDIAFGLFFEWTETEENEVSVHISDSEDEDLDDDYHDDNDDPENGGPGASSATQALVDKGPPTSVIVPIYRRDCHLEVYAGTHNYPGRGVYLLKFDNTYSLWRSKTLYYRYRCNVRQCITGCINFCEITCRFFHIQILPPESRMTIYLTENSTTTFHKAFAKLEVAATFFM